jgi:hypothetical protein
MVAGCSPRAVPRRAKAQGRQRARDPADGPTGPVLDPDATGRHDHSPAGREPGPPAHLSSTARHHRSKPRAAKISPPSLPTAQHKPPQTTYVRDGRRRGARQSGGTLDHSCLGPAIKSERRLAWYAFRAIFSLFSKVVACPTDRLRRRSSPRNF